MALLIRPVLLLLIVPTVLCSARIEERYSTNSKAINQRGDQKYGYYNYNNYYIDDKYQTPNQPRSIQLRGSQCLLLDCIAQVLDNIVQGLIRIVRGFARVTERQDNTIVTQGIASRAWILPITAIGIAGVFREEINNLFTPATSVTTTTQKATTAIAPIPVFEMTCGGPLDPPMDPLEITNTPTGEILSPNYPDQYPNEVDCEVHIKVDVGYVIQLTFLEFDTETGADTLDVFDGDSELSPVLANSLNGNNLPPVVVSTGRDIFIYFGSDEDTRANGFKIKFTAI